MWGPCSEEYKAKMELAHREHTLRMLIKWANLPENQPYRKELIRNALAQLVALKLSQ